MMNKLKWIIIFLISASPFQGYSAISGNCSDSLCSYLKKEISKQYGGARIEFTGPIRWIKGGGVVKQNPVQSLSILGDDGHGNIHFSFQSADSIVSIASVESKESGAVLGSIQPEYSEGWVGFAAWFQAKIALRRIHPGEFLTSDLFVNQDVNIASGEARDYRGIIFPGKMEVTGTEAIQTILEGQYLINSAVEKIPDIRRGDSVQVQLISNSLVLTTLGIAEESGYVNKQIRVIAGKSKRELTGEVKAGKVIEVNL